MYILLEISSIMLQRNEGGDYDECLSCSMPLNYNAFEL